MICYSTLMLIFPIFCPWLTKIEAQSTADDIDFTSEPGYVDLKSCIQNRLDSIGWDIGCQTRTCLCHPSTLASAVNLIQKYTKDDCENADDVAMAKKYLLQYCAVRGSSTTAITPSTLPSSTGESTVTVTVTQYQSCPSNTAIATQIANSSTAKQDFSASYILMRCFFTALAGFHFFFC